MSLSSRLQCFKLEGTCYTTGIEALEVRDPVAINRAWSRGVCLPCALLWIQPSLGNYPQAKLFAPASEGITAVTTASYSYTGLFTITNPAEL